MREDLNLAYCADYEGVLHWVARPLHVFNPLKFVLVIFAVYVLILGKREVEFALINSV